MKKRRLLIAGGALLLSAFAACEPYLSLDEALTGQRCADTRPRCAPGYICSPDSTCVLGVETESLRPDPTRGADGGVGGGSSEGVAGAGSEPVNNAGAGSEPDPTLSAGAGGTPGSAGEGSAGADPGEGLPPNPTGGPDAGCVSQILFRDLDGDTYGSDAEGDQILGCAPTPGYATRGGDCLDAVPTPENRANLVSPGALDFFGVGYPTAAGESFDYDCSESEDVDPLQATRTEIPDCSQATFPTCFSLSGYVPTERTGSGINAICGSEVLMLCNPGPDECFLQSLPTTNPLRCR